MPYRFKNQLRNFSLCMAPFKSLRIFFCRTYFDEFCVVLCLVKFSFNFRLFLSLLVEFGMILCENSEIAPGSYYLFPVGRIRRPDRPFHCFRLQLRTRVQSTAHACAVLLVWRQAGLSTIFVCDLQRDFVVRFLLWLCFVLSFRCLLCHRIRLLFSGRRIVRRAESEWAECVVLIF